MDNITSLPNETEKVRLEPKTWRRIMAAGALVMAGISVASYIKEDDPFNTIYFAGSDQIADESQPVVNQETLLTIGSGSLAVVAATGAVLYGRREHDIGTNPQQSTNQ